MKLLRLARIFGVPQSLIGHHEKGSSFRNANIVTADFTLHLRKKALLPYSESFIAEIEKKMIRPMEIRKARKGQTEPENLFFIYDFSRTEEAAEMEKVMILKNMAQSGVYTIQMRVRKKEGLPPIEMMAMFYQELRARRKWRNKSKPI